MKLPKRLRNRGFYRYMWDDDPAVPDPTRLDYVLARAFHLRIELTHRLARRRTCGCGFILGRPVYYSADCLEHWRSKFDHGDTEQESG